MSKEDFIAVLETTVICADLDVTALRLVDADTVEITFTGGWQISRQTVIRQSLRMC